MTRKPLLVVLALFAIAFSVATARPVRADDQHEAPAASASNEDLASYVPGAAALEGKILAPCCWTQTIDIHGSEIGNALRREIRSRLKAGESADAIQASLVERYGPKILAIPPDSPLASIAIGVLVAIGAAGAAAVSMLKRWRRAGAAPKTRSKDKPDAATSERLDARLDAELRALDE